MKRNRFIPYGYCMAEGKIIIHPEEGRIVIGIFEQYLQGISPAKMADQLNEGGIRFHETNPNWNKGRIYRILADDRYTGIDPYPELVKRGVQNAAKERIAQNRTYKAPDDALARSINGILRCECGGRFKRAAALRWSCKSCGKEVMSAILEQELKSLMGCLRSDPSLAHRSNLPQYEPTKEIMRLSSEIRRAINSKDFDAATLRKQILRCASLKYDALKSDSTPYIRGVIEGWTDDCMSSADKTAQLVGRIAEEIIVEAPDRLCVRLKNGAVIRTTKEETNGICRE